MKQDLQALLDSSEKIRVNQDKIIDNQKKQIETLQAINEKLEAELTEVHTYVRELTKDFLIVHSTFPFYIWSGIIIGTISVTATFLAFSEEQWFVPKNRKDSRKITFHFPKNPLALFRIPSFSAETFMKQRILDICCTV